MAQIKNDGILCKDFLTANLCKIMFTRKLTKLNGETIRCFVKVYAHGIIDKDSTGLLEVYPKFLQNKRLLVAKALINPTSRAMPVRIANPYDQSRILNKDTVVANFEPELLLSVNFAKIFASDAETPLLDNFT